MPAPIGGFLSAGNDWRIVVLIAINLAVATVIYYPFIKAYDKKMLQDELAQTDTEDAVAAQ